MPVNYKTPEPHQLLPIAGIRLGVTEAGIRKKNRRDLTVIELQPGATVAGVFTQNRFCAAPVQVCRQHLAARQGIRALVINTGIANAGTGQPGLEAAQQTCAALAGLLDCTPQQILPFSTGVILEPLPVDRLTTGLPGAVAALATDQWHAAAHGIMTTDTVAKAASRSLEIGGRRVSLTGISKGAGMIKPNMATMLGFMATDVAIDQNLLDALIKDAADLSFNSITVDGDTSTNDSFILMASGASGVRFSSSSDAGWAEFRQAVIDLSIELAQAIVRDGEGATKFMAIQVHQGRDTAECRQIAYAIGHSPLVKTAFFASDPNLGRILAAIGYAGITDLDTSTLRVFLGNGQEEILVAEHGGRAASYQEIDGARLMQSPEITVRVELGRGVAHATIWTCDFSYDYVKINADYRS